MSAPIRRIAALVATRLSGAFRAASRAAASLARSTAGATLGIAKYGALAAGAAGAGILRLVDSNARAAATMVETAAKADITIKTYQELRHAAEMAGGSNEDFDKSLAKFTRTLGDARSGSGALHKALAKTAPAFLAQLKGASSTTDALELMLGALGELEDPLARAKLAQAAFGKSGQSLTLIMGEGAEGLRKVRQEAHDLGLVLDEDGAKKAIEYDDAMTRLKGVLAGVAQTIGGKLLPKMTRAAEVVGDWFKENEALIGQGLETFFSTVRTVLEAIPWEAIIAGVRELIEAIRPLVTTIVDKLRANWGTISEFFSTVWTAAVAVIKGAIAILQTTISAFFEFVGPLWDGLKVTLEGFATFFEGVFTFDLTKAIDGLSDVFSGLGTALSAVWGFITEVFLKAYTVIANVLTAITPEPLRRAFEAFGTFMGELWGGIVSVVTTAGEAIMTVLGPIVSFIKTTLDGLREVLELVGILDERDKGGESSAMAAPNSLRHLFFPTPTDPSRKSTLTFPSAVSGGAQAGAGASQTTVKVDFSNLPAGASVTVPESTGPAKVGVNVGRRPVGATL